MCKDLNCAGPYFSLPNDKVIKINRGSGQERLVPTGLIVWHLYIAIAAKYRQLFGGRDRETTRGLSFNYEVLFNLFHTLIAALQQEQQIVLQIYSFHWFLLQALANEKGQWDPPLCTEIIEMILFSILHHLSYLYVCMSISASGILLLESFIQLRLLKQVT